MLGWPHFALELGAEGTTSSVTRRADGAGFSQEQLLGTVAGCGLLRPWGVCLLGKVGEIHVAGQSIDVPATATGIMAQAGLRLALTHPIGRVEMGVRADGLILITKGIVTLDAIPVWQSPRFAAVLGGDVGVRF
jgi:hypothetical protein